MLSVPSESSPASVAPLQRMFFLPENNCWKMHTPAPHQWIVDMVSWLRSGSSKLSAIRKTICSFLKNTGNTWESKGKTMREETCTMVKSWETWEMNFDKMEKATHANMTTTKRHGEQGRKMKTQWRQKHYEKQIGWEQRNNNENNEIKWNNIEQYKEKSVLNTWKGWYMKRRKTNETVHCFLFEEFCFTFWLFTAIQLVSCILPPFQFNEWFSYFHFDFVLLSCLCFLSCFFHICPKMLCQIFSHLPWMIKNETE